MNRKNLLHLQKTFTRISNITTAQFASKGKDATADDLQMVKDYLLVMELINQQVKRNKAASDKHQMRPRQTKQARENLIKAIFGGRR